MYCVQFWMPLLKKATGKPEYAKTEQGSQDSQWLANSASCDIAKEISNLEKSTPLSPRV